METGISDEALVVTRVEFERVDGRGHAKISSCHQRSRSDPEAPRQDAKHGGGHLLNCSRTIFCNQNQMFVIVQLGNSMISPMQDK